MNRKSQWTGHALRHGKKNITFRSFLSTYMDGNPQGTRKHADRSRITWHRSIQKDLMGANFSWCEAKIVAQD